MFKGQAFKFCTSAPIAEVCFENSDFGNRAKPGC
jgi:hypothetical protein